MIPLVIKGCNIHFIIQKWWENHTKCLKLQKKWEIGTVFPWIIFPLEQCAPFINGSIFGKTSYYCTPLNSGRVSIKFWQRSNILLCWFPTYWNLKKVYSFGNILSVMIILCCETIVYFPLILIENILLKWMYAQDNVMPRLLETF